MEGLHIFDLPDHILRFLILKFLSNDLRILHVCRRFYYLFSKLGGEHQNSFYINFCASLNNRILRKHGQYVCQQCGEVHKCKRRGNRIGKCDKRPKGEKSCNICGKRNRYIDDLDISFRSLIQKPHILIVCRSCRDRFTTLKCEICRVCHIDFFNCSRIYIWNALEYRKTCFNSEVFCRHCQTVYNHSTLPKDCPIEELMDLTEGSEIRNGFRANGSKLINREK